MNSKVNIRSSAIGICAIAGLAASASAQMFHPEVEPNDSKADALFNGAFVLNPNDGVTGTSQGNVTSGGGIDSRDYFLIKVNSAPLGIYRHTLNLGVDSGTLHSSVSIRGLTQSNGNINFASDAASQSSASFAGQRLNAWYGFGREESLYYYVQGTTATTGTYTSTLQTQEVFPTELGTFQQGTIQITTDGYNAGVSGGATAVWVYDDMLNPIDNFGNVSDAAVTPGTSPFSILTRDFTPGTYYLAVAHRNLVVPVPAAIDDRIRTTNVTDFPDMLFSSSTTRNVNVGFAIVDQFGPATYSAMKTDFFEIMWFKFTVGDVPASAQGGCCLPDGSCVIATLASCEGQSGIFQGGGTNCSVTCDVLEGACCFNTVPTCVIMTDTACTAAGGSFIGNGTTCATANCPTLPIAAVEPFVGEVTELFTGMASGFNQCVLQTSGLRPFGDQASICTPGNSTHVTGGWGFFCSISWAGSSIMASTNGALNITFDQPIERFGGYFGTNAPSPGGQRGWAEFYDVNDILIGGGEIQPFRNNCDWYWGGWEFSEPVMRVVLNHSYSSNAYLMIGRLDIDWFTGGPSCYANCDGSTTAPILNVDDFTCFINEFASAQSLPHEQQVSHYANCDGSTTAPALNVDDFTCFINAFAAGCP